MVNQVQTCLFNI